MIRRRLSLKQSNQTPLATKVLTFGLWVAIAVLIIFVDPNTNFVLPFFLTLVSINSFVSASLILKNKRRGALVSLFITVTLLLRLLKIGNLINIVLLLSIIICIESFFRKK